MSASFFYGLQYALSRGRECGVGRLSENYISPELEQRQDENIADMIQWVT